MMKTIGIASDHAGFELKEILKEFLEKAGCTVIDFGTDSTESMDYPDVAHPLAEAVESGQVNFGVAMCGTGDGMAIALNKHQAIRAGLAWNTAVAQLVKQHNNANVLVMPARFLSVPEAEAILTAYMDAEFEGGRHQRRIDKIPCR